jgi:hypothetical protein
MSQMCSYMIKVFPGRAYIVYLGVPCHRSPPAPLMRLSSSAVTWQAGGGGGPHRRQHLSVLLGGERGHGLAVAARPINTYQMTRCRTQASSFDFKVAWQAGGGGGSHRGQHLPVLLGGQRGHGLAVAARAAALPQRRKQDPTHRDGLALRWYATTYHNHNQPLAAHTSSCISGI